MNVVTALKRDGRRRDAAPPSARDDSRSWGLDEGDAIRPGRTAIRLLGGGRRYEAYLAIDDDLLTTVVVKVLRPDSVRSRSAIAGLAAEKDALDALAHPSIPRCFDAVLAGDRPHLVLELIDGPRLSTLVRKYGRLPLEQLVPLGVELASALHYMHRRGMTHLDVKAKNVIMGAPPKLIDLSIARSIDDARRLDFPVGTDAYMAPEQCDPPRTGVVTPAADVWGLGVTLYEAVTGRLPFARGARDDDASIEERFPQLVHEPRPLGDDVPPALAGVLRACLDASPGARPEPRDVSMHLEPLIAALPSRPVLGLLKPRLH